MYTEKRANKLYLKMNMMKKASSGLSPNGFTLIELAISLMVIGLLIGGVLKGQELINNARMTQTIRQLQSYETAVAIFRTTYDALPGDIQNPSSRIPSCSTLPCSSTGNKDGYIDLTTNSRFETVPSTTTESRNFWLHLAKAGIITGVQTDYTGTPNQFGLDFPSIPLDGGIMIQSYTESGASSTYFILLAQIAAPNTAAANVMNPRVAAQLDRKMDDGQAKAGVVSGWSPNTHGICQQYYNGELYQEDRSDKTCVVWVRPGF